MALYVLAFANRGGGKVYARVAESDGFEVTAGVEAAKKFSSPADAVLAAEAVLGVDLDFDLAGEVYRHNGLEVTIEKVAEGHVYEAAAE